MLTKNDFEARYLGKKFHKLIIVGLPKGEDQGRILYVVAECDCGNRKEMLLNNIVYGLSKSCGCERALAVSRRLRNRSKFVVDTPEGPKGLSQLSREYEVPYPRLRSRYRSGITDLPTLIKSDLRGGKPRREDQRLNGKSQMQVAEEHRMTKQAVWERLSRGWHLNEKDEWVSSKGKIVKGVKKQRKRKK